MSGMYWTKSLKLKSQRQRGINYCSCYNFRPNFRPQSQFQTNSRLNYRHVARIAVNNTVQTFLFPTEKWDPQQDGADYRYHTVYKGELNQEEG